MEETKQQAFQRAVMNRIASTMSQKARKRYSDGNVSWEAYWEDPDSARATFTIRCDCGHTFSCVSLPIKVDEGVLSPDERERARLVALSILTIIREHNEYHDEKGKKMPAKLSAKTAAKKPAKSSCKVCGDTLDKYPPWEGPCAHDESPYKPFAKLIQEFRL